MIDLDAFAGSAIISLPCERCGSVINTPFDFNSFLVGGQSSSIDGEYFDTNDITISMTYNMRDGKQTLHLPFVRDEAGYNHVLCRRCAEMYGDIRDEYREWSKARYSVFVEELDKAGLSFMRNTPRWR